MKKKRFKEIHKLDEFKKDFKKLKKKYRTLDGDLETLINISLFAHHKLGQDNRGIYQIPGLQIEQPEIYKVKKFACRSLKGTGAQSGLRLIYAYYREKDRIDLIEIYYKGKKESEDRKRIKRYYKE